MSNETMSKTITVATLVCIFCSVLVSTAAVVLKPYQEKNKALETKRNILMAGGLLQKGGDIEEIFKQIEIRIVNLETGEYVVHDNPAKYDQKIATKDPAQSYSIPANLDLAKIKQRAKLAPVYLVKENDQLKTVILPVYGKGLWSTMYAFIALEGDITTVKGVTFYEHGETPGLGGEVDNALWKSIWNGKRIFDDNWKLAVEVIKGKVNESKPEAVHQVDGLAGATLTTIGISNLFRYWLGQDGFGNYLEKMRNKGANNG